MKKKKAIMNWSGGKDSALALHTLKKADEYQIEALLTTLNEQFDRVSMHGLRRDLLEKQAASLDFPLKKLMLPFNTSMEDYNERMSTSMNQLKQSGIEYSVFGDIFLEDLKAYRESRLKEAGFKGLFPIWGRTSTSLIDEFIDLGFKAILICVNGKHLSKDFLGREIDADLLKDLPSQVDPCGENGEYHSFVYDGPIFKHPINFTKGEIITRTYGKKGDEGFDTEFMFLDLY